MENKGKEKADIIFFCGQSNMQGQTEKLTDNNQTVENAFEYRYEMDELRPLAHPVGECLDDEGKISEVCSLEACALLASWHGNTCLIPAFCRAYEEKRRVKTIAVHVAKGSTTIAEWIPEGRSYKVMLQKAKGAIRKTLEMYEIDKRYFVWLQGESDAICATGEETYKNALFTLNDSLKRELAIHTFAVIRVGRFTNDERDEAIACAQEKACVERKDFVMLTRLTNELLKDVRYSNPNVPGHYSSDGQELLGEIAGSHLASYALGEPFDP